MKRNALILMSVLFAALSGCKDGSKDQPKVEYPETKKVDTTDVYFGTEVPDPYRWLENDTAPEVEDWVERQNEVTFSYLEKIPFRDDIKKRLKDIWNYPKYSAPSKKEGMYFYFKNDGLQNQSVLYMTKDLDKEGQVLLDPNKLSEEGTASLSNSKLSDDGKYLAYGISRGGSDWTEMYVMNVNTKEKLSDHLEWVKFSGIAWKDDGFYYSRYDKPEGSKLSAQNEYHKIYYHKVGTPQSEDKLVHWNPDKPKRNYTAGTTEDERYLLMYESAASHGNALYYKDLEKENDEFHKLAEGFEYEHSVVDHMDGKFIVKTNYKAPKYRLVLIDPDNPEPENWKDLIPEQESVLQMATIAGNKLVVEYMVDANSKAYVYNMDGEKLHEIDLPGIGSMGSFRGNKKDNEAFYTFSSYVMPSTIYRYNIEENKSEVFRKPEIDFDSEKYETKQVFYESKDGTEIPMFITHKKGLKPDGNNPVYLYGYGGFNVSLTPGFRITMIPFMENGGVFAVPNLRGGGEYGEKWHEAGTKMQKQNVFDDFISAAEYLIDEDYTKPEKIAISGGSNGGLLVGACMTQRPDLFGVALPAVGVMDMLRYHKFTIGWHWAGDYGTSEDSKEMFEYLYNYSPLHNIKDSVEYPATLVTTADHDDRVVPAHSFKFIATLQEKQAGKDPVLIRIETKAGHGAGKPTDKIIEETADKLSFLFYNMNEKPSFE
ncbi:MAG: prolyl oligopeptidase family serine peptidase [Bacteroidales bacterium]|nr:prolyl oligopeptidase family serine peptidase [Bacteroidales bacterium]